MYCRACKTELAAGVVVCTSCGLSPYSGSNIAQDVAAPPTPMVVVCASCGTALNQNTIMSSQNSNKLAAGLCGLFLGCFGVHKFILGYQKEGIIMLLVSLLTCGIGLVIMSVIGFVEGIIYLTRSDADFENTYVLQQKPWF